MQNSSSSGVLLRRPETNCFISATVAADLHRPQRGFGGRLHGLGSGGRTCWGEVSGFQVRAPEKLTKPETSHFGIESLSGPSFLGRVFRRPIICRAASAHSAPLLPTLPPARSDGLFHCFTGEYAEQHRNVRIEAICVIAMRTARLMC